MKILGKSVKFQGRHCFSGNSYNFRMLKSRNKHFIASLTTIIRLLQAANGAAGPFEEDSPLVCANTALFSRIDQGYIFEGSSVYVDMTEPLNELLSIEEQTDRWQKRKGEIKSYFESSLQKAPTPTPNIERHNVSGLFRKSNMKIKDIAYSMNKVVKVFSSKLSEANRICSKEGGSLPAITGPYSQWKLQQLGNLLEIPEIPFLVKYGRQGFYSLTGRFMNIYQSLPKDADAAAKAAYKTKMETLSKSLQNYAFKIPALLKTDVGQQTIKILDPRNGTGELDLTKRKIVCLMKKFPWTSDWAKNGTFAEEQERLSAVIQPLKQWAEKARTLLTSRIQTLSIERDDSGQITKPRVLVPILKGRSTFFRSGILRRVLEKVNGPDFWFEGNELRTGILNVKSEIESFLKENKITELGIQLRLGADTISKLKPQVGTTYYPIVFYRPESFDDLQKISQGRLSIASEQKKISIFKIQTKVLNNDGMVLVDRYFTIQKSTGKAFTSVSAPMLAQCIQDEEQKPKACMKLIKPAQIDWSCGYELSKFISNVEDTCRVAKPKNFVALYDNKLCEPTQNDKADGHRFARASEALLSTTLSVLVSLKCQNSSLNSVTRYKPGNHPLPYSRRELSRCNIIGKSSAGDHLLSHNAAALPNLENDVSSGLDESKLFGIPALPNTIIQTLFTLVTASSMMLTVYLIRRFCFRQERPTTQHRPVPCEDPEVAVQHQEGCCSRFWKCGCLCCRTIYSQRQQQKERKTACQREENYQYFKERDRQEREERMMMLRGSVTNATSQRSDVNLQEQGPERKTHSLPPATPTRSNKRDDNEMGNERRTHN